MGSAYDNSVIFPNSVYQNNPARNCRIWLKFVINQWSKYLLPPLGPLRVSQ